MIACDIIPVPTVLYLGRYLEGTRYLVPTVRYVGTFVGTYLVSIRRYEGMKVYIQYCREEVHSRAVVSR